MIHILTVHWQSPDWVDLQLDYFRRFLDTPYVSYAYYTAIDAESMEGFDHALPTEVKSHSEKLNQLALIASEKAESDEDILLFIDGDAFPIRPLLPVLKSALADYPLVAVQRLESGGDMQPHPCFCATTVKFWREIEGDWRPGYSWRLSNGQLRTDVGGNLLGKLLERDIDWKPVLRSYGLKSHGMYFGVYGDVIYHHGAAFRDAYSTYDMMQTIFGRYLHKLTPNRYWRHVSKLLPTRGIIRRNNANSREVYECIQKDPTFFEDLDRFKK